MGFGESYSHCEMLVRLLLELKFLCVVFLRQRE